jgi:hypothetical protein
MLGKWVLIDDGEYYQVGEITFTTNEYAFVRMRPPNGCVYYRLYDLMHLAANETMFFESEKELDAFIEWIEKDSSPKLKVVSLKGKNK